MAKRARPPKRPTPQPSPSPSSSEGDADLGEMRALMARMEAKRKAHTLCKAGAAQGITHPQLRFFLGRVEAPV